MCRGVDARLGATRRFGMPNPEREHEQRNLRLINKLEDSTPRAVLDRAARRVREIHLHRSGKVQTVVIFRAQTAEITLTDPAVLLYRSPPASSDLTTPRAARGQISIPSDLVEQHRPDPIR